MSKQSEQNVAVATIDMGETRYAVSVRAGEHGFLADEPEPEGADAGPSPFGLVLSGLGACTAITLRMYAERKGLPLKAIHIALAFSWRDRDGSKVPHIERELRLDGPLDDAQRARCAEIADKSPVTRALKGGIEIQTVLR